MNRLAAPAVEGDEADVAVAIGRIRAVRGDRSQACGRSGPGAAGARDRETQLLLARRRTPEGDRDVGSFTRQDGGVGQFSIRPLSETVGVELDGVDFRLPFEPALVDEFRALFEARHLILV